MLILFKEHLCTPEECHVLIFIIAEKLSLPMPRKHENGTINYLMGLVTSKNLK